MNIEDELEELVRQSEPETTLRHLRSLSSPKASGTDDDLKSLMESAAAQTENAAAATRELYGLLVRRLQEEREKNVVRIHYAPSGVEVRDEDEPEGAVPRVTMLPLDTPLVAERSLQRLGVLVSLGAIFFSTALLLVSTAVGLTGMYVGLSGFFFSQFLAFQAGERGLLLRPHLAVLGFYGALGLTVTALLTTL